MVCVFFMIFSFPSFVCLFHFIKFWFILLLACLSQGGGERKRERESVELDGWGSGGVSGKRRARGNWVQNILYKIFLMNRKEKNNTKCQQGQKQMGILIQCKLS